MNPPMKRVLRMPAPPSRPARPSPAKLLRALGDGIRAAPSAADHGIVTSLPKYASF